MKKCNCTPKPEIHDDLCWEHKCACEEDHTHYVENYRYTTTVKTKTPFNMPAKGEELMLELYQVDSVLPEALLWNPRVGYLRIKTFSKDTSTVIVENPDIVGNLTVGSAVLADEEFMVGVPTVDGEENLVATSGVAMLSADFVAPGAGGCQLAIVTTVNGITEGGIVSIQGYQYRVASVVDRNTLKLCDDGKGAPKGNVIDAGCEPSVTVVPHSSNPCTNTPRQKGKVVICDNGEVTTIEGDSAGQGLIWDGTTWTLKYIDTAVGCTTLTSCWVLDTTPVPEEITEDNPAPEYLLNIFNIPAGFRVDNKITIYNSDTGVYDTFIIKEIVSNVEGACQIRVSPTVTPTAIHTFGRGEVLCLEECCDWVPSKLADTVDSEEWRPRNIGNIGLGNVVVKEVDKANLENLDEVGGSSTVTTDVDGERYTIVNSNKFSTAVVFVRVYCWLHGRLVYGGDDTAGNKQLNLKHILQLKYTTYSLNSSDEVVPADHYKYTVLRRGVSHTITSTNKKSRDDFFQALEVSFELPQYDEEHPELGTAVISASSVVRLLKKTDDTSWNWINETSDEEDPEEATPQKSVELRIAIEGVRR